jgi:hypothetical protein
MQSSTARAGVLVALVAAAVILFVVLKGGDSDSSNGSTATTAAKPLVITVDKAGKPVDGVQKLTVSRGDRIRFTVDSAVADEVHLHGYDIPKDVKAGGSVSFDVPATLEGEFEAELESRHEQILDLTVNP